MVCSSCDGYGFNDIASAFKVDLRTLIAPNKKGGSMPLAAAQAHVKKMQDLANANKSGIHIMCSKCGGTGVG